MSISSIFKPHGKCSVEIRGQVLLTEVTGPWNRELVDYWAAQALALAKQFRPDYPYVAVTVVHESILCPPDALERVATAVEYANQYLSCVGHCIVAASDVDGRDLIRFVYARIQLGQIFESLEDAMLWASQQLQLTPRKTNTTN